ncbi:Phage repressor protein C, contains Cro/C1-type HTH and peptisase s24 domains [Gemmobacter megaterium]|uniref:Phage repressor protein C, contains Cro/C1-type HTH and peptisase s24 domains n=1 Tax=Gemmobacter megaterium TaxID=1086013 RepID=A0A1N7QBA0_9RHOB|nr:helix-turn-helix domain-containing protein [Gemmobacter megaterium]GGE24097.1 transcriptional regulator [Gemmobacter megaterium]SIT20173.1 Phage repressor protein C, contains Cro/C1-type HTH and peptisase s24 domains [Gemmobacter megaterium]
MRFLIRQLRQERRLTLEELAEKAGISRSYLNELELGAKTINANRLQQVARALGVEVTDLFASEPTPVAVAGQVGAGARVPLVDMYAKGGGLYHVARPPQLAGQSVVAVEVEGDSMAPMYQPGHVLFFSRNTHEGIPEEDVGRPCVVEDASGMAWVKMVKRGSEPGRWNLISLNPDAESVWDVPIKWAARVRFALPAELVERI